MDCEEPFQSLPNRQSAQEPLVRIVRRFLSAQEVTQIIKQFQSENWVPNGQVLWSGILREKAQEWAERHQLQTLTTAMGSLMDEEHPGCLKSKKNLRQWRRYVHGASALFAWRIAQGERVTLLSPPPPERFHPSGLSYFQLIEEPIIRGLIGQNAVQKIIITHPMIEESEEEEFYYELWPNDGRADWERKFGSRPYKMKWRQVGHNNDVTELRSLMTSSEGRTHSSELFKEFKNPKVGVIKPTYGFYLLSAYLISQIALPIFILFALLCSLFGKMGEKNNATTEEKGILKPAETSSTVISTENINTEQATTPPRQRLTCQMVNMKKQAQVKAEHIVGNNPKYSEETRRKSLNKAHQEGMKRLRDQEKAERKFLDKAHKEAMKKRKVEVKTTRKALDKEYQGAIKKLQIEVKAEWKALDKTHQEAMKKLKNQKAERNSLDKAHEEAIMKRKFGLKAKRKALDKEYQNAIDELKAEAKAKRKALSKVQQKATKDLRDKFEAKRRTLDKAY